MRNLALALSIMTFLFTLTCERNDSSTSLTLDSNQYDISVDERPAYDFSTASAEEILFIDKLHESVRERFPVPEGYHIDWVLDTVKLIKFIRTTGTKFEDMPPFPDPGSEAERWFEEQSIKVTEMAEVMSNTPPNVPMHLTDALDNATTQSEADSIMQIIAREYPDAINLDVQEVLGLGRID